MDIERMFNDEIKEKKRAANGVHHKTGKRGYTGRILFASDFLKGKAKKEYQGTGKVRTYNMYDTILEYKDFTDLPEDKQKKYLEKYRESNSNKAIMGVWGIGHNLFYKIVDELGVVKTGYKTRTKRQAKEKQSVSANQLSTVKDNLDSRSERHVVELIDKKEKGDGMTLSFNGTYSADDIVRKLEKFGLILSDEEVEFKIELKIAETV